MKKVFCMLLMLAWIFQISLPCRGAEIQSEGADSVTGDVYARYVRSSEWENAPVVDGMAEVTTDNGYTVTVTGAPSNATALRVVPIPSTEVDAWSWFSECIGKEFEILSVFDIYFMDADDNRVNADGVSVGISNAAAGTTVFSVTKDGNVAQLSAVARSSLTFTANGSPYYVLASKTAPNPPSQNDVIIQATQGGNVQISDQHPKTGDIVTITPIPDEGKEVDKVDVKDGGGKPLAVTDNGDGTFRYVQPDGDVTIQVIFRDIESVPKEHKVIIKDTFGGKVEVSDMTPVAGQIVTITPKPDSGKIVKKVTVTDQNGKTVKVTDKGNGIYRYTQPDCDVTVKVTFTSKSASPATGDGSNIGLWFTALGLSALALSWIILKKEVI